MGSPKAFEAEGDIIARRRSDRAAEPAGPALSFAGLSRPKTWPPVTAAPHRPDEERQAIGA